MNNCPECNKRMGLNDLFVAGFCPSCAGKYIIRQAERIKELEAENEQYEEALKKIGCWAYAYPLDVFPEPDFKKVDEVLKAAGLNLDVVSASNMRHVIEGVKSIVEQALKG